MKTIREKILELLLRSKRPLTAREIAIELGVDPNLYEREVYEHLRHIAKTVRRVTGGRKQLYMIPPVCRDCNYVFKDLKEPRKPSRCPRCKSYRIQPPKFYIA
ncbi:MAG: transcriptional regulator [Pyrodictiaceae archaeon]